jgi:putative OPT family oligopeptide transporter
MHKDLSAILFGVLVSTVLAGTLVIAGLKAGITPGVSPLVILVAWGAFARILKKGGTTRFLNIAQVAGSAGMAVTAGVIFTAPLLQILYSQRNAAEVEPLRARMVELRHEISGVGGEAAVDVAAARIELAELRERYEAIVPPVDVPTLILVSLAGALIGFGFVGLATKKFLTDPSLPAPEARACETMIEAAAAEHGVRPRLGRSLYAGLGLSFLAPLIVHLGLARDHVVLWARQTADRNFSFDLPFLPIYIGIGGLLTLATALLVFTGSSLRLVGDFLLAGMEAGGDLAERFPNDSMRWVGGAAMTVCVAYSLVKFMGPRAAAQGGTAGDADDPELVEVSGGHRTAQVAAIAAGILTLVGWIVVKDGFGTFALAMGGAVLVMCMLMVTLGALLSLQIGSSASPVSGTIFVTTLVLCLVALAVGRREIEDVLLLTPLLVGACVAVCAANDSSQDYKTLQLCGVKVQDGFLAQILGLVGGAVVVPIALYVAHGAYTLGSDDLPAPQGVMFATLIDGLLLKGELPWWPIAIGAVVGVGAVALEIAATRRGMQMPSMALAVGIYLPPYIGVGILLGAFFRWLGERGSARQSHESILAAAGLITGAAALDLILGVTILARPGFTPEGMALTRGPSAEQIAGGMDPAAQLPLLTSPVTTAVAVVGILGLGALLLVNSRRRRA